jgi:quercetin dioxygenase-like cupin family protein
MVDAVDEGSVFQAPTSEEERAGTKAWKILPTRYDRFMESEDIPVFRGLGIHDVRELPLAPWKRLGGRGSYIQLDGTEKLHGMYVVEIPAAGALNPERHIYDEVYYVVEGRGTTEVWYEGASRRQTFEWQTGSLFTVPLNAFHRLVNARSSPAIILAGTTAPVVVNEFPSLEFVFDNGYKFVKDFEELEDYYKPREDLEVTSYSGRAARRSNIHPDIVGCELPLDNQRFPGFRRIEPFVGTGHIGMILWEYPTGRYSRAHAHTSGAVIICLQGRAYTYNWPVEVGLRPWESGHGDQVRRFDYKAGGMVAAAPGGGRWFHQHFACSKEKPRFLVFAGGGGIGGRVTGRPGQEYMSANVNIEEGGASIDFPNEDPMIRKIFQEELAKEGVEFTMPASAYEKKG